MSPWSTLTEPLRVRMCLGYLGLEQVRLRLKNNGYFQVCPGVSLPRLEGTLSGQTLVWWPVHLEV